MKGRVGFVGFVGFAACRMNPQSPPPAGPSPVTPTFSVLVFSKTAGFRHDSIPNGIAAVRRLGSARGFSVDATEDAAAFTDQSLAKYETVVFLSTTGNVLNAAQEAAFERDVRGGGGFVGVHSAADTEYDWPFYGGLVGIWSHTYEGGRSFYTALGHTTESFGEGAFTDHLGRAILWAAGLI